MMEFADIGYSEEQVQLLDIAADFCRKKSSSLQARALMDSDHGFDRMVWDELTALGWTAIAIPEEHGGAGLTIAEAVPIAEQMGRTMLAAPFGVSVVTAMALVNGGNAAQKSRFLPMLAEGKIGTLALFEPHADWDVLHIDAAAQRDGDTLTLSGSKQFVMWGQAADFIIVSVRFDNAAALIILDRSDLPAGALRRERIIDETKRSAALTLDGISVPLSALMDRDSAERTLQQIGLASALLQSAEMCGGTLAVIDYTASYLQTRKQFGNVIGSFQALKHPLVDAYVDYEKARSHLYSAAYAFGDQGTGEVAVRMAKAAADKCYSFAADRAIQFHGGFGFTHDCDAGLHRRAAIFYASQYGDAAWQRARLADLMLA
jgi:acyl-CoA dehydrogenase